jgi:hypothetical protein
LKSFNCRKRGTGFAKVIHERKRKSIEKIDKCPRYLKPWVLRCPSKKREEKRKRKR